MLTFFSVNSSGYREVGAIIVCYNDSNKYGEKYLPPAGHFIHVFRSDDTKKCRHCKVN